MEHEMAVIRTTRFTLDPADAASLLDRRRKLLDTVRARFADPAEAQLIRVDEQTWVDIWRWESPEALQAALTAAPNLQEAAAAFAIARDVSAEQGDVVDGDVWTR
jgi:hypothetical protein